MKPVLGDTIIAKGVVASNGTDEHPAIITRVWGQADTADTPVCVNVTIFPDLSAPIAQGSVMLYANRDVAYAAQERGNALDANHESYQERGLSGPMVAFWPERDQA